MQLRQPERSHNGGTISADAIDHILGQRAVDQAAAAALRVLHDDLGMSLVLASNTLPHETRWPALQQAGIVLAAAGCPAGQVLFVGDHLQNDAAAPARHGMRTALVRPNGLRPGEALPDSTLMITHVRELPALLATA